MGGRGSVSTGGRDSTIDVNLRNVGGAPDKRADIQKSFVDELGFKAVRGTNRIPTATLNSYAIALKKLEREYGAIAASENAEFVTGNGPIGSSAIAAVYFQPSNPKNQFMAINTNYLGSTSQNLRTVRSGEQKGHFAQTDKKITRQNSYAVTHEYGHMLENALASKSGKGLASFETQARNEITEIAQKKYGAGNSKVSGYGTSNAAEFFAESFASLHSGNPNAYGKALGDWLKSNKLK